MDEGHRGVGAHGWDGRNMKHQARPRPEILGFSSEAAVAAVAAAAAAVNHRRPTLEQYLHPASTSLAQQQQQQQHQHD